MPPSVCLAISSFRNDDAVQKLLEAAAPLVPSLFSSIIVVDSLGTGRIAALIDERGWSFARYECARVNLGSAGNLARRLELSAESGADYVYALNHDGLLSPPAIEALVQAASNNPRIGAAYPLRILPNRARAYDVTNTSRLLLPRRTRPHAPSDATLTAYWGSSNGALYALAPVREGLSPWADLWMGWEDLGYGWLLASRGYQQVIVRDAVFEDPYEFKVLPAAGGELYVTDKPAWYAYYFARNLILIGGRLRPNWPVRASLVCRIALECGATTLLRSRKQERLRLLARGIIDGVRGVTGKLDRVP